MTIKSERPLLLNFIFSKLMSILKGQHGGMCSKSQAESGRQGVQGEPWPHIKFEASLVYEIPPQIINRWIDGVIDERERHR